MVLVYSQSHPQCSRLLSRPTKHHGRQSQRAFLPGLQIGVGPSISFFLTWGFPEVDLFATITNGKCKQFCSRGELGPRSVDKDPSLCISSNAFDIESDKQDQARQSQDHIAPDWPRQAATLLWFAFLFYPVMSLLSIPHFLSTDAGQTLHPNLGILCLKAWLLKDSWS